MNAASTTNSNGGDIVYDTTGGIGGGDITIATLRACGAVCPEGGSVRISADGSILGVLGLPHISATSAALIAAGDIGAADNRIKFDSLDPNADAGGGQEILLQFEGAAYISEGDFNFSANRPVDADRSQTSKVLASVQAAAQEDDDDVDWAAYSEEVTLYEINNDGVKLPQDQQADEFAKLLEEVLREQAEGESVSDTGATFQAVSEADGIPVSQLLRDR